MKRLYIFTALLLTFLCSLQTKAQIPEPSDSLAVCPEGTDSLMMLPPSPATLIQLSPEQEEVIRLNRLLQEKDRCIDSLSNQLADTVVSLNKALTSNAATMEEYEKKIISLSSYLFFIPYYQSCIEDVAVPAFESLKGSPLYDRHQVRLSLLKNYRKDIEELIRFFNDYKTDRAERHVMDFDKWKADVTARFANLDAVKSYKKFEFGDQTYLGNIIRQVNTVLASGSAEKIDKTFAFYVSKLETDLKEGSR